jgi:hypothetical protein
MARAGFLMQASAEFHEQDSGCDLTKSSFMTMGGETLRKATKSKN